MFSIHFTNKFSKYTYKRNHTITDRMNQYKSRRLSGRMQRTGVHMPRMDWKSRVMGEDA